MNKKGLALPTALRCLASTLAALASFLVMSNVGFQTLALFLLAFLRLTTLCHLHSPPFLVIYSSSSPDDEALESVRG